MACYVFAWIVVPSLATSSLLEAVLHLQCPCSHYAIMKSYTPAIKRKGRDSGGGADAGQQEKPRTGEQSGCIDGVCKDPSCRHKHHCSKCGDRDHVSHSCPNFLHKMCLVVCVSSG